LEVTGTHCYFAAGVLHHNTLCEAVEVAFHATGLYSLYKGPNGEPWPGHRFAGQHFKDAIIQVGSTTDTTVRDRCQADLCGDPEDPESLGTGWIPKDLIVGKPTRKPGIPNAFDSITVKHVAGINVTIRFRSYEQGPKKHMGSRIRYGWCDEEPPQDIWSQYIRGTIATSGTLAITMTPEEGLTQIVYGFLNDLRSGQALVRATWDDAPHMTPEMQESKILQIPENERRMRRLGVPTIGSGLIFPVTEEQLVMDPIEIPDYWPRICGVDFGSDHPFAAVWWAFDRETQTAYLYDCYRERKALISTQSAAIKARGDWIPVAWPHDGMVQDKQSGRPLADIYRDHGLFMLPVMFSNPPLPGQKEGSGGPGVEVGLLNMHEAMEEGRIKVFSTCKEWLEERRTYHRDQTGKIVKKYDDCMSASRYGYQMSRFAMTKSRPQVRKRAASGLRNW